MTLPTSPGALDPDGSPAAATMDGGTILGRRTAGSLRITGNGPQRDEHTGALGLRWIADTGRRGTWFVLGYRPSDDPGVGPRVRMVVGEIDDPETSARSVAAALNDTRRLTDAEADELERDDLEQRAALEGDALRHSQDPVTR